MRLKQRARLAPGETLLVLGAAGGVGTTAVELGRQMGATVIAAASSDEKLELARSLGAEHLVNYATEDLRQRLKEITGGRASTSCTTRWAAISRSRRCAAWPGAADTS